jgi:hypothetical protein
MKLYKLTNADAQTKYGMTWGAGVTNDVGVRGMVLEPKLCTLAVIHAYTDPLMAALLHPVHVRYGEMKLWEAEGDVVVREGDLKVGVRQLTTIKEIPLPKVSLKQRVKFAVLCALDVINDVDLRTELYKYLLNDCKQTKTIKKYLATNYRWSLANLACDVCAVIERYGAGRPGGHTRDKVVRQCAAIADAAFSENNNTQVLRNARLAVAKPAPKSKSKKGA